MSIIKLLKLFSTMLTLLLLVSACSNKPAVFTPLKPSKESGSVIYIYRPSALSNAIISPELIINGKKILKLSNNSYLYLYKHKGKQQFKLNLSQKHTGNTELTLETKPAETYFLRVSTSLKFEKNKPYTRRFDIELVESGIALNEIKTLSYAGEKETSTTDTQTNSPTKDETNNNHFSIKKTRQPFSR